MADWNLPTLTSSYSDFLDYLKARDEDSAKMFDGVGSNLGAGTIRWNSGNKRFEKYDGTNWSALVSKYMIDVDNSDNLEGHPSSYFLSTTGKAADSDKLDGYEGTDSLLYKGDIPDAADLNTYNTAGLYHQGSNTSAANGTNYPFATAGMLTVKKRAGFLYQTYEVHTPVDNESIYTRGYYSGTWGNWNKGWHSGNDGAGSALDAGYLEGHRSNDFVSSVSTASSLITDFNTAKQSGFYSTDTNTPNAPSDDTSDPYDLIVIGRDSDNCKQIAIPTWGFSNNVIYTRSLTSGTWNSWIKGVNVDNFNYAKTLNGYQKLPGSIIQWGEYSTAASRTFPIAFPTACTAVMLGQMSAGSYNDCAGNITTTGFDITAGTADGTSYIAIGY